jgi:hypothetical protein
MPRAEIRSFLNGLIAGAADGSEFWVPEVVGCDVLSEGALLMEDE